MGVGTGIWKILSRESCESAKKLAQQLRSLFQVPQITCSKPILFHALITYVSGVTFSDGLTLPVFSSFLADPVI